MQLVRPQLIELRQYVIAPGGLPRMLDLFDRHFAAAQDGLGMPILGHFTVQGDPDRLVWLRGFSDMESRPDRLGAFYGGPVWEEFGAEAIGLVADYSNVQLLREAAPNSGIAVDLDARPPAGEPTAGGGMIVATTYVFRKSPDAAMAELAFAMLSSLPPGRVIGRYVGDPTPNNFLPLPIRQGEHLFTWFAACTEARQTAVNEGPLAPLLAGPIERLVLRPAKRSVLR